jgi:hypothetical protein
MTHFFPFVLFLVNARSRCEKAILHLKCYISWRVGRSPLFMVIYSKEMKGIFFIWQWNIPSCHNLHIVNGMGSQSYNWFKNPKKYQLNSEKEHVNLLLFFVICYCWNCYLLEIMFSRSYYLLEFLLLVGRDVCWKCCSPIITTCCKNCYLLEELLFSNCCYLLK